MRVSSDKYKVFAVLEDRDHPKQIDRIAGMTNTLPYPIMRGMALGEVWWSTRTDLGYERIM